MKKYIVAAAVIIALSIVAIAHADIYGSTLKAWWTLDSNDLNWTTGQVTDNSGNSITGQMRGLATTTSPFAGFVGQSLEFTGVSQYIDLGTPSSLNFNGSSNFSVSAWITNASSSITTSATIFSKGFSTNTQYQLYINSSNKIAFGQYSSGTNHEAVWGTALTLNQWYFVVGTWNGSTWKIYVNNGPPVTNTTTSPPSTGQKNCIGCIFISGTASRFYQGNIDDLRVYNTALTTNQIASIYQNGLGKHHGRPF